MDQSTHHLLFPLITPGSGRLMVMGGPRNNETNVFQSDSHQFSIIQCSLVFNVITVIL